MAARTINVFSFYEAHLAGGQITLFPFLLVHALARAIVVAFQSIFRVVNEILHPQVDSQQVVGADTYWAALRKIHRMRKPVFMGSLWLRARFDVEYMGLLLPTAPASLAGELLMEADLDYIGATRRDRIIAEQFRLGHQKRLEWVARWLDRFNWTFDLLPNYLAEQVPYLANRGGEALRAVVAACILDHDDIATLALSGDRVSITGPCAPSVQALAAAITEQTGATGAGLFRRIRNETQGGWWAQPGLVPPPATRKPAQPAMRR